MIKFSQEKVLLLHKLITEETGGDPNVRDIALLNSALESAFATFDGKELYPTKQEKGARLGFALISNHAFVDGNKRIGMYVLLTFLETNGVKLRPTNAEVARVGLAIAAGEMKYEELLEEKCRELYRRSNEKPLNVLSIEDVLLSIKNDKTAFQNDTEKMAETLVERCKKRGADLLSVDFRDREYIRPDAYHAEQIYNRFASGEKYKNTNKNETLLSAITINGNALFTLVFIPNTLSTPSINF